MGKIVMSGNIGMEAEGTTHRQFYRWLIEHSVPRGKRYKLKMN